MLSVNCVICATFPQGRLFNLWKCAQLVFYCICLNESVQQFKDINEYCERLVELLKGNINSSCIEKWLIADSDAVSVFREHMS